jgi:Cu(I)/Ag(I) efflux system periplasmic protein CusF
MLKILKAALIAAVLAVSPALADGDMVKGEVVKVDKAAGKVTLKHGPIKKLDMDGMTMVFRVADPAMLDKMKAGDKIEFEADRVNGAITVTKIGKGH